MYSVKNDSIEVKLNPELWELFTLQAELETMRRCGRHYAPTVDEMREELIFDAVNQHARAQSKLDQMRRRPVDTSNLLSIAKLCFVSSKLVKERSEVSLSEPATEPLLGRITHLEQLAEKQLNEVVSDWLLLRSSDWIKASVLTDDETSELIRTNIIHCCGEPIEHPGVEALTEALVMLSRDYKKEFEYLKAAADNSGWEVVMLDTSPAQPAALAC